MRVFALTFYLVLLTGGACISQKNMPGTPTSKWSIAAGMNLIHITPESFVREKFSTGFMLSLRFRAWQNRRIFYQSELMFSGQGYEFETPSSTGSVGLGYLYLPQIIGVSLNRIVDIQLGLQPGILLIGNADSIAIWSRPAESYGKTKDWFQPFIVGVTAGVEVHPLKHLTLGGRLNHSLTPFAKNIITDHKPSFLPPGDAKLKVCWMNFYIGYSF